MPLKNPLLRHKSLNLIGWKFQHPTFNNYTRLLFTQRFISRWHVYTYHKCLINALAMYVCALHNKGGGELRFRPRPRNHHRYRVTSQNLNLIGWKLKLHCRVEFDQYAVKAQTSLAPLSRFRGSQFTTAHEQQCCSFQSYAKSRRLHAVSNEIDKRNWQSVNHIPGIHDNGPPDHGLWRLTLTAYSMRWVLIGHVLEQFG